MATGRHRQHLDRTVGKLDQMVGLFGQSQVLLLGPEPLKRRQIDFQPVAARDFQ